MTPVYEDGLVRLYHGDFREVLPALDLTDVSATVTDPPYGETSLEWDRWPAGWPTILAELVPEHAPLWCFGSMRMFLEQRDEFAAWSMAQEIVWEKHNGSSSAADRFRRVHEFAVQWYRGPWADVYRKPVTTPDATARQVRRKERPPQWGAIGEHSYVSEDGGPRLARSVLYVRSMHGSAIHPTEKPAGILDPLLAYSVPDGGLVLDPMAGSASTLIAARSRGLRAIGIEARPDYCERAAERLQQRLGLMEVAAGA